MLCEITVRRDDEVARLRDENARLRERLAEARAAGARLAMAAFVNDESAVRWADEFVRATEVA